MNPLNPPQQPASPSPIRRAFNAYRLVKLILLVAAILGAGKLLTPSPPTKPPSSNTVQTLSPLLAASSPPTDTITITITWDQWADIQNATWFIQGEISNTLQLTSDTLSPSTIKQSHATIARYKELYNTVIDQAEAQTHHIPDNELNAILDHQIDRQQDLLKLLNILDKARFEWLTETLAP